MKIRDLFANTHNRDRVLLLMETLLKSLINQGLPLTEAREIVEGQLDEDLRKWFRDKWVRFGPDGKIRGPCARGKEGEGKPKCLPQRKAWALGKKKRATAARRKRRQDPNPTRKGAARMVATKEAIDLEEKRDACYYKVKSRYKVWPSAYASGALVQCRKKGARNWGNKK